MVMSEYPSIVVMPEIQLPYPTILEFLANRFPSVSQDIWETRIRSKKVLTEANEPISFSTPYTPLKRLYYFKEVAAEPIIPFSERIIFCNEELLVACKPHFLPVIPSGPYVNECLLHRLKKTTGNKDLSPINRIDRETAGLVLFSMNKNNRGRYQELFMNGTVNKTYEAVTHYNPAQKLSPQGVDFTHVKDWIVENRLVKGDPWFRMKTESGKFNAVSKISLVKSGKNRALFQLHPRTGKKHQLRLHLSGLGFPILNDRYYPDLLPKKELDFSDPLQLLARKIQFTDPISLKSVRFKSKRQLLEV